MSSKDDTLADTLTPRRRFLQLTPIDQQLSTSGPTLGRAVQAKSVWVTSSFSRSGLVVSTNPGKFKFGVSKGGVDMNIVEMEVWRILDCCLGRVWILPWRFQ